MRFSHRTGSRRHRDGMSEACALDVAITYHDAWTGGKMDEAAACLADDLLVEVPINAYPTKSSFVDAVDLTRKMTSRVTVLSTLGGDGDALILYDMALPFGVMRVAEHFSVSDGRITRIRQVHDTHMLRAAAAAAEALG